MHLVARGASTGSHTSSRWGRARVPGSGPRPRETGAGGRVGRDRDGEPLSERALEEVVERASDGEVSIDVDAEDGTSELTFTDDEGGTTTVGTGQEVPAAFTQAVDLPGSLEVVAATEVEDGDGTVTYSVTGTVAAGSMDDVMAEVDAGLGGWTLQEGSEGVYSQVPEMDQRMLHRGDEVLMVLVMSEDAAAGPHQVSYLWSPDAQG